MSVVLFLGPTLPSGHAPRDWCVRPPARQGDVFRAVRDLQPHAVGLVDGVFLDVPSVWHRELLWALDRGVHVFGAASMGALRAAELDRFGMVGVGRIYEAYRDAIWPGFPELFEDDDEVAVVHAPLEAGGEALSDAMVDLRATLRAAVAAGRLDERECQRLAAAMKARPFPDRSLAALARAASPDLSAWIAANPVRQKRVDAVELIDRMAALNAEPFVPSFRFTRALAWERFVAEQSQEPASPALAELRYVEPARWRAVRREALGRLAAHAIAGAPTSGAPTSGAPTPGAPTCGGPTAAAARIALQDFRMARGLMRYEDIQAWLRHTGLDAAGLARLIEEEAALDEAPDPAGLQDAMLDVWQMSKGLPP